MDKNAGSMILALVIVLLVVVSSVVVYLVLDSIDFFDQTTEPIAEEEVPEDEVLDPIAIKVMDMMQQMDEPMVRGYIEKLTSFGGHPTARRILYKLSNRPIIGRFFDLPIEKVAKYLYNEFESMGLEVRYQYWEQEPTLKNLMNPSYYPGWIVGNNVIATLPGTDPSSDEEYVLVAHYDTMGRLVAGGPCPGANDDSSGVALLLSAAKLMSQHSFNHTVHFIAVDGEEQGLYGSKAYAEAAAKNSDNIVAAISIDMIGTRAPGIRNTEVMVAGEINNVSNWIVNFTINVNQRYPEFLNFTIIKDDPFNHGSDHKPFLNQGYDAVLVEEAANDYDWHRSSDILKNMDTSYTTEASRLVLAVVAEMAWDVEYE
jgi:hypothetical protein